jgi:hypothetical protein
MRFLNGLALLAGTASAGVISAPPVAPAPNEIKIVNITAIGSGCPAGHAYVNVDATATVFDVAFDEYIVTAGPGTSPANSRKNCRISINLAFPSGYQ